MSATAPTAATSVVVPETPAWLRSSAVVWLGTLLGAVVVTLAVGFVWHEWRALEERELLSADLYARVLQDHAERTFDTVDITLNALTDSLLEDLREPAATQAQLSQLMVRAQSGLPFVRSLSLMTGVGRIVASSSAANLGVLVDVGQLRLPAGGAVDALGSAIAGRDLADVARTPPGPAADSVRSLLPLVRRIGAGAAPELFLVAVLNPDFFANAYELTLADTSRGAALVGIDKVLLAAGGAITKAPGASVGPHPFIAEFLPDRESGRLIGPGVDGGRVFTAFRMLRKRPALVIVERDFAHVQAQFLRTVYGAATVGIAALMVIATIAVMGWRSLRAHEAVRRALAATREDVAGTERDMLALVESVHELIFRADRQGHVTFVNGRWRQLTGRSVEEIVGRRFSTLCAESERPACDALFAPASGGSKMIHVKVRDAAGLLLTMELSVSPVVAQDGAMVGFAGFAVDISDREAARQALESQLRFTAQLLEIIPTPIFVKDPHGRFTTVNRAWLELMDMTLPQVLGRRSFDLFGAFAVWHTEQDLRLLTSTEPIRYENRLQVAGKSPRDTIVAKVRFTRADGTPAGIVGSIIDVTEFREAERRIGEARDAAASANAAKSRFIANISHELRTPLQAIIGFSEIGAGMSRERTDVLELFNDIQAGGWRMLTLVNGLLDISQLEGTVGSLTLRRDNVALLMQDAVREIQPTIAGRNQQLVLNGFDVPRHADIDRARFQQAMRNLLSNAARYAPAGSLIEVGCADDDGGLLLTVRDRGPGIPTDELEAIFEPFVQSSRTRDGSGGTGLGLTISRRILRAHGGNVVAANAPGGGALLRVTVPAPGVVVAEPQLPPAGHDAARLLHA